MGFLSYISERDSNEIKLLQGNFYIRRNQTNQFLSVNPNNVETHDLKE